MFKKLTAIAAQRLRPGDVVAAQGDPVNLIAVCEDVIEQNAPALLKDDPQRKWLWLLVAIVLDDLQHFQSGPLKNLATPLMLGEVARRVDIAMENPDSEYERVCGIAEDFAFSIAPRRAVSLLLNDRQAFKARLDIFIERRSQSDQEVRRYAETVVEPYFRDNPAGLMKRFRDKIPTARLRAYHDQLLRQVGQNFAAWDPLLEFLEDSSRFSDRQEEYQRLVKSLGRSLGSRQSHAVAGVSAEDAVHDAVLIVLTTLTNPRRGYTYEGEFIAWLSRTSLNILKANRRKAEKEESLDADKFNN